jgi:REP element-mobilizing transposase RayT
MVFHVLNRAVGRRTLFSKEADYVAFERVLEEALRIRSMRVCAYCVMPNHWHFVVWPERDGDLSAFLGARGRWRRSWRNGRSRVPPIGQPSSTERRAKPNLAALRHCVNRGCPYGDAEWVSRIAETLALEYTLRPRGRPKRPA